MLFRSIYVCVLFVCVSRGLVCACLVVMHVCWCLVFGRYVCVCILVCVCYRCLCEGVGVIYSCVCVSGMCVCVYVCA